MPALVFWAVFLGAWKLRIRCGCSALTSVCFSVLLLVASLSKSHNKVVEHCFFILTDWMPVATMTTCLVFACIHCPSSDDKVLCLRASDEAECDQLLLKAKSLHILHISMARAVHGAACSFMIRNNSMSGKKRKHGACRHCVKKRLGCTWAPM